MILGILIGVVIGVLAMALVSWGRE